MHRREPFIAQLLLRSLRAFELDLQQRLVDAGYADVSIAHMNLLRHLDAEGMHLITLAEHAGVSKQAVTHGVRALEARDLARVVPDPRDRRAKRVVYTDRGKQLVQDAIIEIVQIEAGWAHRLGTARYQDLRSALRDL